MKHTDFQRGVIAAASVAEGFDSESTHPYRLGDIILCKLNVTARAKPRRNKKVQRREGDSWTSGFAVALVEMHRRLLNGNDSTSVREVARAAGVTLEVARAAGVSPFDLKELKKAGVK